MRTIDAAPGRSSCGDFYDRGVHFLRSEDTEYEQMTHGLLLFLQQNIQ